MNPTEVPAATSPVLIDKANDITAFASTDSSRYVLNGVHVNGNGVEASDGRIVIRVPFVQIPYMDFPPNKTVTDEREQVIIPTKVYKEALSKVTPSSALPVLSCVRISTRKDGDRVKAQLATTDLDSDRVLETKSIEGTFPKIDQVYPTDVPHYSICIHPELLKRIAEYALKHGDEKHAGVKFQFGKESHDSVRFNITLSDGREARGVVMPMRLA